MPQSTILLEISQPADSLKKKSTCRRVLRQEKHFDGLWIAHFYKSHTKRYCVAGYSLDYWYEVPVTFPLVPLYEEARQK